VNNFSTISWQQQVIFRKDDDDDVVCFVLDKHTE
jgi:hypothetical protein